MTTSKCARCLFRELWHCLEIHTWPPWHLGPEGLRHILWCLPEPCQRNIKSFRQGGANSFQRRDPTYNFIPKELVCVGANSCFVGACRFGANGCHGCFLLNEDTLHGVMGASHLLVFQVYCVLVDRCIKNLCTYLWCGRITTDVHHILANGYVMQPYDAISRRRLTWRHGEAAAARLVCKCCELKKASQIWQQAEACRPTQAVRPAEAGRHG